MDSFWSKLLILGIVAAIGLFFIHNVYTPQRSAQEAMAESTQQSVDAVKAGVDETLPLVSAVDVKTIASDNFGDGEHKKVIIEKTNRNTYTFEDDISMSDSTYPSSLDDKSLDNVLDADKSYRQSTTFQTIRFMEQD